MTTQNMTTNQSQAILETAKSQGNIDQVMATMTSPDTDVVNSVVNTDQLPSYAVLDLDLSHEFNKLVAYQKFHSLTLRDGEIKTIEKDGKGINVETLYNVVIIGTTVEKTGISKVNTRFFTAGEVFISPKDKYYSHVGTIVEGELSTDFDTRKLISPKVKQFLASQIKLMVENKATSDTLRDARNLKSANHLKSLIKPRSAN